MTQQAKRATLFDAWAARYDTAVAAGGQDFPFAGYDEVLTTAVRAAAAERWATWWDADEFYWAADEAIAVGAEVELSLTYQQVSRCAGVFTVTVANGRAGQPEQATG